MRSGDLDGDGDSDVVAVSRMSDLVTWWENTDKHVGDSWTEHTIATLYDGATSLALGDIDQDGGLDALSAYRGAFDYVSLWTGRKGSSVRHAYTEIPWPYDGFPHYPAGFCAADMDKDGDLDLVASGRNSGQLVWFENRPTTSGDVNRDGLVNLGDLAVVAGDWLFGIEE